MSYQIYVIRRTGQEGLDYYNRLVVTRFHFDVMREMMRYERQKQAEINEGGDSLDFRISSLSKPAAAFLRDNHSKIVGEQPITFHEKSYRLTTQETNGTREFLLYDENGGNSSLVAVSQDMMDILNSLPKESQILDE